MSDLYREIMVPRKTSAGSTVLKVLLIALTVIGILGGMIIWPLLIVGLAAGIATFFFVPKLQVEFEYLYVNGDLDIDAIYSRQKRKRVAEYHVEELEILAPEKSHALDCFRNQKDLKVRDFTSREPDKKVYALVVNKEKGREYVKVELDDTVLADLRRLAPRKVNLM